MTLGGAASTLRARAAGRSSSSLVERLLSLFRVFRERLVEIGACSVCKCDACAHAGHVIGVEMTEAMLEKARGGAADLGLDQLEYRSGFAESLPVTHGWADLVISNGDVNLSPTKERVFSEISRVLRPGGRLQIADITVERPVPEDGMRDIDRRTN